MPKRFEERLSIVKQALHLLSVEPCGVTRLRKRLRQNFPGISMQTTWLTTSFLKSKGYIVKQSSEMRAFWIVTEQGLALLKVL